MSEQSNSARHAAAAHARKISQEQLTGDEMIETILCSAREELGMEVAYFTEIRDAKMRVVETEGDETLIEKGMEGDLTASYCQRVFDKRIEEAVPDASLEPEVRDLEATHELGIGSYVGVPLVLSDGTLFGSLCCLSRQPNPSLAERDLSVMHLLARVLADYLQRERMEKRVHKLQIEAASVEALTRAIEARDQYTGTHSDEVLDLARRVAQQLNLPEDKKAEAEQVAILHDLGKIGIPDSILHKEGPLSDQEWEVMREHPVIGERIIQALPGLEHLAAPIRAEHERWDGEGYPDGLAGDDVPLASCIALVCDAYHAMISDRPYRQAIGHDAALKELRKHSGTQFNPVVVEALLGVLDQEAMIPTPS